MTSPKTDRDDTEPATTQPLPPSIYPPYPRYRPPPEDGEDQRENAQGYGEYLGEREPRDPYGEPSR